MADALSDAALVAAAGSLAIVAVLLLRRLVTGRRERRRLELERALRQRALAFIEGEAATLPGELAPHEEAALSLILRRYTRALVGESRERMTAFFVASGHVDRELGLLHSRRAWRRAGAAHALGDLGSRRAVEPLLAALAADPDRDVRASAARSLGMLGVAEATGPLVHALVERRVPVASAGQALLALGAPALPQLRMLGTDEDPGARALAAALIGRVGEGADAAAMAAGLGDGSAEVRAACARALGRLAAREHASKLREALDDRIPFVREAAAIALGQIGDREAVPALIARAADDPFEPAQAAAQAAALIDPAAVARAADSPHLAEALDLARVREGRS